MDSEQEFQLQGQLEGHNGWVTALVAGNALKENEDSDVLVSGSRDHTIITWALYKQPVESSADKTQLYGQPLRQMTGHNHFVSDLTLSQENTYLISSSWDKTLRLWDLKNGRTVRQFNGHTKEVFSVAFSSDNKQIISAGADKVIKLWNTRAENKFTTESNNHGDWVSCVRYSPLKTGQKVNFTPYFTTVGWDGRLKIWDTNFQIRFSLKAHDGHINCVAISPNGKYLATGGRDKKLHLWDVSDLQQPIRTLDAGSTINQISFNPKLQWVSAATEKGVKVWDLISPFDKSLADLRHELPKAQSERKEVKFAPATAICWNSTGRKLFVGFTDGKIRVWQSQGK